MRLVRFVAIAVLVGACGEASVTAGPPPVPQPCAAVFNAVRCLAMTDYAATQLHVRREDIAAIDVLPEPTPEIRNGTTIIQTRSGGPPIDVRVTMADGSTRLATMNCVGIASHPACLDDPHLVPGSITAGGYRDVPCAGEPPTAAPRRCRPSRRQPPCRPSR